MYRDFLGTNKEVRNIKLDLHKGPGRVSIESGRRASMPAASICLAGGGCLTRRQTRQATRVGP